MRCFDLKVTERSCHYGRKSMSAMKLVMPEEVNERSRLVGWTVAVSALLVFGALMLPHMDSSLVFVPLLLLSALAGALASSFVRYRARRKP